MAVERAFRAGRIRLHVGIAAVFVVIVAALTAGIIWNNHRQASAAALQTADQLFTEIARNADERMNRLLGAVKATVDAASAMPSLSARPRYDGLSHAALETMLRMIETQPYVFSVFVGFGSGDWIQVVAPRDDPDILATFQAPPETHFIVRTISTDRNDRRREYFRYLDHRRHVFDARSEAEPSYDPRGRDWYQSALAGEQAYFTDPYVFFALHKPGITGSRRLIGGGGVVGIAVTLASFADFLSAQAASPNAAAFLFNAKGEVLAHQDPTLAAPIVKEGEAGKPDRAVLRRAENIVDPIVEAVLGRGADGRTGLSGMARLQVEGQTHLLRVAAVGRQLGLDQHIAIAAPLSDFDRHIVEMQQRSIVASLLALAVALPLIYLIARRIAAKLAELAGEADKIRSFDLDGPVAVESRFIEVHELAQAFGAMKQALAVFGRYVPKALVRQIVQSGTTPELGGQRREITVLFTDISGYTRIAEDTEPEDLMLRTSAYFEALGAVLSEHHGVVDKYIGDAIMALWNAPSRDEDHVAHACAAVLAGRAVSRALAERWQERSIPAFGTRFGLHCGEAVVGNVGGADRINFTAVGGTINLAARLEALNKLYGTEVLVSEAVAARAGEGFLLRRLDRVQPVGVVRPSEVYELMAARPGLTALPAGLEASAEQLELHGLWTPAEAAYAARDWPAARAAFEAVLRRFPGDPPARVLAERCRGFVARPPDPDWDGVTRLSRK
ncbi:MAG: adenylate/guanylate cyclase domain-containing protein [Kiloniellales bacterium]|nr:adenylate/guanylate cyclase domain-containing protein [Kiloniellales bacterium]